MLIATLSVDNALPAVKNLHSFVCWQPAASVTSTHALGTGIASLPILMQLLCIQLRNRAGKMITAPAFISWAKNCLLTLTKSKVNANQQNYNNLLQVST